MDFLTEFLVPVIIVLVPASIAGLIGAMWMLHGRVTAVEYMFKAMVESQKENTATLKEIALSLHTLEVSFASRRANDSHRRPE